MGRDAELSHVVWVVVWVVVVVCVGLWAQLSRRARARSSNTGKMASFNVAAASAAATHVRVLERHNHTTSAATLARGRNYAAIMRDVRADERLEEASECQPSFYILGAMKAASTRMAELLSRIPGVVVHPHEHHFWESYPAVEWERGDEYSVLTESTRVALQERTLAATLELQQSVVNGNGAYAPFSSAARLCEAVIRDLAPHAGSSRDVASTSDAGVRSVCRGAEGTLAASLVQHHNLADHRHRRGRVFSRHNASAFCRGMAFGVKAPSHLSEWYVPLRLAACAPPPARLRMLISLRDPVTRAYSSWTYKNAITLNGTQRALLDLPGRFARDVELEISGLRGLDLADYRLWLDERLPMELYVRLVWQRWLLRGRIGGAAHENATCSPSEYGGHDKLAGLIKGFYAPQILHWFGSFPCSDFLISALEAHTPRWDSPDAVDGTADVLLTTLAFLGLSHLRVHVLNISKRYANARPPTTPGCGRGSCGPMRNSTRALLIRLFAPANAALGELLARRCQRVPLLRFADHANEAHDEAPASSSALTTSGGVLQVTNARSVPWLTGQSSSFVRAFVRT